MICTTNNFIIKLTAEREIYIKISTRSNTTYIAPESYCYLLGIKIFIDTFWKTVLKEQDKKKSAIGQNE